MRCMSVIVVMVLIMIGVQSAIAEGSVSIYWGDVVDWGVDEQGRHEYGWPYTFYYVDDAPNPLQPGHQDPWDLENGDGFNKDYTRVVCIAVTRNRWSPPSDITSPDVLRLATDFSGEVKARLNSELSDWSRRVGLTDISVYRMAEPSILYTCYSFAYFASSNTIWAEWCDWLLDPLYFPVSHIPDWIPVVFPYRANRATHHNFGDAAEHVSIIENDASIYKGKWGMHGVYATPLTYIERVPEWGVTFTQIWRTTR